MYIGDDHGAQRAAASRTPAHDVSHPPVTLSLSKRPHVEHESASEADGTSERDYESYVDSVMHSFRATSVSLDIIV